MPTAKKSMISIISIMLISIKIFAAPTITSVTGVSYFIPAGGTATMAAFGGMAGTCASPSSTTTCNTCTDATTTTIKACNPKSINPNLVITVGFTTATAITNRYVQLQTGLGTTSYAGIGTPTRMTIAANGSGSVTTTWGQLCAADAGIASSTCIGATATTFDANRTLGVGIDDSGNDQIEAGEVTSIPVFYQYVNAATATKQKFYSSDCSGDAAARGACGFTLTPGDSKLYIDKFFASGVVNGAPVKDGTDPDWLGVAFFVAPVASAASIANNVGPVIKAYNSKYGLDDSKLDGLNNYTKYCVMMGNINKAYNIIKFTATTPDDAAMCGTPSEVVGVLDDKHCFISTAAFGSDMAPEVQTFRQFRNQFLLTNSWGRSFVKMYYQYGPTAADFISKSEGLRTMTRVALYPFLAFSYVSVEYGFNVALLTLMVALILLSSVSKFLFKHKKVLAVFVLIFSFNLRAQESSPRLIKHPGAAEGLIRIDKDGNYIYAMTKDLKKQSGHLYIGQANNPDVSISIDATDINGNPTGAVNSYNFDDFYKGTSKILIGYDYEWFPWAEKTMLGIQAGASFMYADGHGRLVASSTTATNPVSQEKFSFLTLPLNLGLVYRFQYKDTQMFVPYVDGGGTYMVLAEKREDKSAPNFTGGFGFYGAGGLLINLTAMDRETAQELNSEYGIGNLWLSLEFKAVEVEAETFKFSSQFFNAGVSFDF
ncbi:MAG: hypothetical protein H7256_11615 [Bdellovibrio sp.]|nr:hypothetical protein [Bdellovibrio sp.]